MPVNAFQQELCSTSRWDCSPSPCREEDEAAVAYSLPFFRCAVVEPRRS